MWSWILVLMCAVAPLEGAEIIRVDFTKPSGSFKPMNGVNKGPVAAGGLVDVSPAFAKLGIPFVRLHDCHWPNPDVVDIHVIFPRPEADPSKEASYDFALTDSYLQSIRAMGAQIIYRLGESIEHTPVKRFVHPPADPEKWARICLGIIRHYNEGWADGFKFGVQYWEIWNEPENRPVMWTGTEEQYLELYRITSRRIKEAYPELKVGGPAIGYSGSIKEGKFVPGDFLLRFLAMCRDEKLPLDFFSWHCYTDSLDELIVRARAIRAVLDDHGFAKAESHLTEWNYLPNNDWKPVMREAKPTEREVFYRQMSGPEGAAFAGAALIAFQNLPLDVAGFFHAEVGGFGLFNEYGAPNAVYAAFQSYGEVLKGRRVSVPSDRALQLLASVDSKEFDASLLVANPGNAPAQRIFKVHLPAGKNWSAKRSGIHEARARTQAVDSGDLTLDFAPRSISLIRFGAE